MEMLFSLCQVATPNARQLQVNLLAKSRAISNDIIFHNHLQLKCMHAPQLRALDCFSLTLGF